MTCPEDGANDTARKEADSGEAAHGPGDVSVPIIDDLEIEFEHEAWLHIAAQLFEAAETGRIKPWTAGIVASTIQAVLEGYIPASWVAAVEKRSRSEGLVDEAGFYPVLLKAHPDAFTYGPLHPYVRGLAYVLFVDRWKLPDRKPAQRVMARLGISKRAWMEIRRKHLGMARALVERLLAADTLGVRIIRQIRELNPAGAAALMWLWLMDNTSPVEAVLHLEEEENDDGRAT